MKQKELKGALDRATVLMEDWILCNDANPKDNVVEVQIEKDQCTKWANQLKNQLLWGSETEIAEACNQFEPKLKKLKEKVVLEILQHGSK